MKIDPRIAIRTALVYFPFMQRFKSFVHRTSLKFLKIPFEEEFRALEIFPEEVNFDYLDVGGNEGLALDAIRMYNKSCMIHSFEPNKILAQDLKRKFRLDRKTNILNFGLGNNEGCMKLFLPEYRGFVFHGLASFNRENAALWLSNNQLYFYNENNLTVHEYTCEVKKLDDLGLKPFFIKMDVGLFELSVLKGGENTIRTYRPVILSESAASFYMDYLRPMGYEHYHYDCRQKKFLPDKDGQAGSFLLTEDKLNLLNEYSAAKRNSR